VKAPALLPHQAETSSLKLKAVRKHGEWRLPKVVMDDQENWIIDAEYLLTRSPSGLSDRPVNKETTK